jgi:uncharacterized membrane protein
MSTLIAGLVLFLGIHSIAILSPALRDRLAARLGTGPWKGLYALVATIGLVLVIRGFLPARALATTWYIPTAPMRWAAVLLMLPVFPCLWSSYLPGRIQSSLRHPMLVATKAWAVAHLLANGSSADVLLFGSLLAWAVAERISLKRRPARALPMAPPGRYNDLIAVLAGLVTYALFVGGLHRALFGVAPIG